MGVKFHRFVKCNEGGKAFYGMPHSTIWWNTDSIQKWLESGIPSATEKKKTPSALILCSQHPTHDSTPLHRFSLWEIGGRKNGKHAREEISARTYGRSRVSGRRNPFREAEPSVLLCVLLLLCSIAFRCFCLCVPLRHPRLLLLRIWFFLLRLTFGCSIEAKPLCHIHPLPVIPWSCKESLITGKHLQLEEEIWVHGKKKTSGNKITDIQRFAIVDDEYDLQHHHFWLCHDMGTISSGRWFRWNSQDIHNFGLPVRL